MVHPGEEGSRPVSVSGNGSASILGRVYQSQAQFPPRPFNLGLDYAGQSPSTPFNPSLYQSPSQRSLFPQFDRWFSSQGSEFHQQPSGYVNGTQMDSPAEATQMPRHPVSSARMHSYWNEYDEPSMMSSSLYNIPILPGAQSVNLQPPAQPLYPEAEYPSFS
jgi:hypothetical protein